MFQKTITIILVMIVIGGLAWYVNKNYIRYSPSEENQGFITNNKDDKKVTSKPALMYLTKKSSNDIWSWQDGHVKKIYTDSDESEKILKVSNIISNKFLAIVNKDSDAKSGKLVEIDLANRSKKNLQDYFTVPKVLSLSPNLLQIAYINFSNVEENYGYTLYVENKDGNLKKQIYNSSSEIKSPSWDPDSKKIVYSVMTETAGKLKKTTISSKNTQDILSLDNKMIDSCFWQKNGQVVYSDRKIGANNGDIGIIDTDTNKIRNLTSFKGGMANFIYSDDSLNYFGYIVGQYIGEINEKTIGQIFIFSSNNQENKALEKGNQILGWST